jgi:hypothetical protein
MVITREYDVIGVEADYGKGSGLSVIAVPITRWPKLCCCYHRERTYTLTNYVYHAVTGSFVAISFQDHMPVASVFKVSSSAMRANLCAQLPSSVIQ